MSKRDRFFVAWLVGGAVQVVAAVGCIGTQSVPADDHLLSSGPEHSEEPSKPVISFPVRVNRALFEAPLTADVSVSVVSEQVRGAVEWEKRETDIAPGEPGYIADYRDFWQCAGTPGTNGFRVCFRVAPDVSTIDLSAAKLKLEGVEAWVTQAAPSSCIAAVQDIGWLESVKTPDGGFSILYGLTIQWAPGCSGETRATLRISMHP